MADIRINSLSTTAASTASDDFVAVDGSANGTRKLNAYSPTFGGNLTVSGTGGITSSSTSPLFKATTSTLGAVPKITLEHTAIAAWNLYLSGTDGGDFKIDQDSTNKFRMALGTGNVTLSGNLTVSGGGFTLGTTNYAKLTGSSSGIDFDSSAASNSKFSRIEYVSSTQSSFSLYRPDNTAYRLFLSHDTVTSTIRAWNGSLVLTSDSGTVTVSNNLTVSGTGTSSVGGKWLVGTGGVDSGALLQVGTNTTTSAGGMVFGTDASFYRYQAGGMVIDHIGGTLPALALRTGGTERALFYANGSTNVVLGSSTVGASLTLISSNGLTALTLDSSQNATFAGTTLKVTSANSALASLVTSGSSAALNLVSNTQANYRTIAFSYGATPSTLWTIGYNGGTTNTQFNFQSSTGTVVQFTETGAATFSGAIAIGNTVNTVSPTSPNRTITMVIGGTTYYIHAKTTND